MEIGTFFQGILEHWFAELLLVVGGVVFAYLRKKTSWAPIALYALCGVVGVSVLIYTFTGRAVLSPTPVSESNVEDHIKTWVSHFGYGMQTAQNAIPNADFAYAITSGTGLNVVVYRDIKNRPSYIQLSETLAISPEHQQILGKITSTQAGDVLGAAGSEIIRRNMALVADAGGDPHHVTQLAITKSVPISGLTEAGFGQDLDDINSALALARYQFLSAIEKYVETSAPQPKVQ